MMREEIEGLRKEFSNEEMEGRKRGDEEVYTRLGKEDRIGN